MKKKKITVAVISAISALILMLGIVPSLAKYVTEQGKQSTVVSDNFYFTSDYHAVTCRKLIFAVLKVKYHYTILFHRCI